MIEDATTDGARFAEGRYVYCVVAAESPSFEAEGVEDEPVYAIEADGIAAIVHDCDSLYDADDLTRVREWLLDHQAVVDEAGQAFGTPLPFQFDTIVTGDDEAVREWLREGRAEIETHLADLGGHWEYRITIERVDEPEFDDETLDGLESEADGAEQGRSFLLEKQKDRRERELRRALDEEVAADARARLEPHVREIDPSDDADAVASLSVLAHEDDEAAIGEELDAVAAREGIEVTFTGPWPPYSFAPEL